MARSGAYISDVHLLEDLDKRIGSSGEAMSQIDANVCNYLNEVRDNLQRQLDFIHDRLNDAQQRLSQAESALSACQASQSAASAMGMMCPSCVMEEQEVEMARMKVEEWRMRYEQGQQIVGDCEREIAEYNGSDGGHSLIRKMCDQQTPKASQLLHGCIDRLQDILGTNVGSGGKEVETLFSDSGQQSVGEVKSSSSDRRFDAFRRSVKGGNDDL